MSQFVCNHCFIDYGDKQSFIEHTHKVVERKEKRAVKSTTKSQTDNTEWLDDIIETSRLTGDAYLQFLRVKDQILAKLKQQDIKSRIDEQNKIYDIACDCMPEGAGFNRFVMKLDDRQKKLRSLL